MFLHFRSGPSDLLRPPALLIITTTMWPFAAFQIKFPLFSNCINCETAAELLNALTEVGINVHTHGKPSDQRHHNTSLPLSSVLLVLLRPDPYRRNTKNHRIVCGEHSG